MGKRSAPLLRVVQGASGRRELVTEDSPPDIQTEDIGGREPIVVKTQWRDIEDDKAHLRRHGAKYISGWRRTWTIERLHTSSPREITEKHLKAAQRLVDDFEMSCGVFTGRSGAGDVTLDPIEIRIAASRRYEEAMQAMGIEAAVIVFHAAIDNWSLSELQRRFGFYPQVALGLLSAALGRLRDHYSPPTVLLPVAVMVAEMVDAGGLAQERVGRYAR